MKNKVNHLLLFMAVGVISGCATNNHQNDPSAIATTPYPTNVEKSTTVSISSLPEQSKTVEPPAPLSPTTVTLAEVANLVIHYHPRIAQSLADAKGQEEMIAVARAQYYPQITGGIGVGHDQNASGVRSTNSQTVDLEVNQTLYDFGKIANQVRGAELAHEGAKTQSTINKEELVHTATTTLLDAARQKKLLELSDQHITQMNSLVNLVKQRHASGASNLSEELHAESRLNEEKSARLDIAAIYDQQLQRLKILTGMPSISGVSLDNLPPAFKTSCSQSVVWEQVPEYLLAEIENKRAETELELAKAERKPTFYLSAQASRYLNRPDHYRSHNDSRISLNMSVPIYQGGALSARKRAYAEYAHAASLRKEEVRLEVEQFLADANIALSTMLSSQRILEERVKNLGSTRTLYKAQYLDLGSRSLVDLLNSEQEYHRARLAAENNKLDAILTQLNCAYFHGKLSEYLNPDRVSSNDI